ncbi:hypothetical protein DM02DRAFT_46835 [Periconia macrospinosa]|uniref:Uncharacterized protein n=1 Tax=Periconia macrospinosa TaxID=97972 RepID=A0A2V1DMV3_9PLEO|nr:hypothetical protein DM02DRAFT_46835 [Periconia macrospinosa]
MCISIKSIQFNPIQSIHPFLSFFFFFLLSIFLRGGEVGVDCKNRVVHICYLSPTPSPLFLFSFFWFSLFVCVCACVRACVFPAVM